MRLVYFPKIWKLKSGEEYHKGYQAGWLSDDGGYALTFGLFVSKEEVERMVEKKHPGRTIAFMETPPKNRDSDRVYHFDKAMVDRLMAIEFKKKPDPKG